MAFELNRRKSFRLSWEPARRPRVRWRGGAGRLIDVSADGACIALDEGASMPRGALALVVAGVRFVVSVHVVRSTADRVAVRFGDALPYGPLFALQGERIRERRDAAC